MQTTPALAPVAAAAKPRTVVVTKPVAPTIKLSRLKSSWKKRPVGSVLFTGFPPTYAYRFIVAVVVHEDVAIALGLRWWRRCERTHKHHLLGPKVGEGADADVVQQQVLDVAATSVGARVATKEDSARAALSPARACRRACRYSNIHPLGSDGSGRRPPLSARTRVAYDERC